VAVSGFISSEEELYAIFDGIDVFCYLLPGGLTARRASVLAAAASGKPVVVNAPEDSNALNHHRLFKTLIGGGQLRLIPTGAGITEVAEAVLEARRATIDPANLATEIDALWDDVIARIDGAGR
jgi:glycosyltransferase involved in cell wall biosynthesis